MKKLYISIIATILSGTATYMVAEEFNIQQRGPAPFSAYDQNGDEAITVEEFDSFRKQRQAARAAEGRMMRNAANALSFADLDTDKNGELSQEELTIGQQAQMQKRGGNRGSGMGGQRGMGRRTDR